MKKTLLTLASALALAAGASAAESLWDGTIGPVKLREGAKLVNVSAKAEAEVLTVNAVSEGDPMRMNNVSVEVAVTPFVLGDRALALDVWSDQPATTESFYVRGVTADNKIVLSFMRSGILTSYVRNLVLVPERTALLKWESDRIQAPLTAPIAKLWFYMTARGGGKKMNLNLSEIRLVPLPADLPALTGTELKCEGVGDARESGGVVTALATAHKGGVVYFNWYVPFTGKIEGKKLCFTASTATPATTHAFYVRGYNAKDECILSYKNWNRILTAEPKEFQLTVGSTSAGMEWEPPEVKANPSDRELVKLRFFIGTRNSDGKLYGAKIENIRLAD
jgi:hypothetical protein